MKLGVDSNNVTILSISWSQNVSKSSSEMQPGEFAIMQKKKSARGNKNKTKKLGIPKPALHPKMKLGVDSNNVTILSISWSQNASKSSSEMVPGECVIIQKKKNAGANKNKTKKRGIPKPSLHQKMKLGVDSNNVRILSISWS